MSGPGVPQGNPPPTLRTYLRALWPAVRDARLFRDVRTFCLFIGVNRSGSSLVGSLLNAHRHALIAHELNALHFVRRRFPRLVLYRLLKAQDEAFESAGRQWYGYDYRVAGQWQGRHERLLVIGDKHAGGATHLLGRRPDLLFKLQCTVGVPVKMIHVVRHPLDNIATIHGRQNLSLASAADYFFEHAATNARLVRKYPGDVLTVSLEDMIKQPRQELARVCRFLSLDAPHDFLKACRAAVFDQPRASRTSVEWPTELIESIAGRLTQLPPLTRYVEHIRPDGRVAA